MTLKYCIVSAQYMPHMGGVERYTYYIAKKLLEKGNQVTVVTSNLENEPMHEKMEGIEVIRIPSYQLVGGRFPVYKHGKIFRKIKKKLAKKGFDQVIVNTRFYPLSLFGVKFAKKNKIPCLMIEHGTSYLTFNNPVIDIAEHLYEKLITHFDKKYCKNFYGVSQACCEWSGHFKIQSKGVLYNAVDLDEMEQLLQSPVLDYKKELGITEDDFVISYTGRMIPEKGIVQLMNVISKIKSKKRLVLVMAGDGPLLETAQAKQEETKKQPEQNQIITLGRVDFPHIAALLQASDLFCLPSDSEGFPTSVLEAVAAKCFVITTKQGGAKELIDSEELGIIMEDNREDTIEAAITQVLESDAYRTNAVEQAYERLKSEFTFDATVNKIEHIAKHAGMGG